MKTKIQILRETKGYSKRELARLAGVSDTTIRRLEDEPERYRTATLETLKKIADVFKIKVTDLIDESLL